ncbi:hypothetical protein HK097_006575 [Rhizophlyctis rosea]|uniref:MBL fold metallo-hydrolase n=1 Tax=Rhizophlyctis rosea TaxID=64517 RepID=A0AAD5X2S2_9FUNG|nr:hypothetical protein HK097_006575 [Rhizophlyctis rosea]
MVEAIRSCAKAREGKTKVTVDVHPDYPEWRGIDVKGKKIAWQKDPTFDELEKAGGEVQKHAEPHTVSEDTFHITGEIPRVTEYETGLPQIRWMPESRSWEPDPLIMDERFVAVHVKDKGLVVFTGCSHAGLVNVCKHAREAFPDIPLHAVVGGFHLAGHNEARIEPTINDLKDDNTRPQLFLPGHCTGWRARGALEMAFPDSVIPIGAGNTIFIGQPNHLA